MLSRFRSDSAAFCFEKPGTCLHNQRTRCSHRIQILTETTSTKSETHFPYYPFLGACLLSQLMSYMRRVCLCVFCAVMLRLAALAPDNCFCFQLLPIPNMHNAKWLLSKTKTHQHEQMQPDVLRLFYEMLTSAVKCPNCAGEA